MRIAMIGPFGLDPKGTMRVRALPLAKGLVARGHAAYMIMPPWQSPEKAPCRWEDGGVALEYVPLGPAVPLVAQVATVIRLVRRVLAWKPDVIHCWKPKAYAGLAAWVLWHMRRLGLFAGLLIVDEDDWEGPGGWNSLEPYSPLLQAFFAWQERWGIRHNDMLTVASRALETVVWSHGVSPQKVRYLPNGFVERGRGQGATARGRHGLGEAPTVLLYTRFVEFDVARVVRVFAGIHEACPAAHLLVVGKGLHETDDTRFEAPLRHERLEEWVRHAGWVAQGLLADYFAAATVALYPFDDTLVNRTKCAVKLVDLLAAGVPVVADAVGQNREYVRHEQTGLLVDPADPSAMVQGAVRLLGDPQLASRLGGAAAAAMRTEFALPALVDSLLRAYSNGG